VRGNPKPSRIRFHEEFHEIQKVQQNIKKELKVPINIAEELVKIDKNVRDPEIKAYHKMKKKGC